MGSTPHNKARLQGQRFGKLCVMAEVGRQRDSGAVTWACRCDCGGARIVSSTLLKRGKATHCGCVTSIIDMTGRRCGRFTVVSEGGRDKSMAVKWLCVCDCGTRTVVSGSALRNGRSTNCGCVAHRPHGGTSRKLKSTNSKRAVICLKHGMANAPEYRVWEAMKRRCANVNDSSYAYYGGRGIRVCAAWNKSFPEFFADMGRRPPKLTLDRIDNDGDYTPNNCRWATREEQCLNRRSNRWLTVDGERKTITQWSRDLGASDDTVAMRMKNGWSVEDAVSVPVGSKRSYAR